MTREEKIQKLTDFWCDQCANYPLYTRQWLSELLREGRIGFNDYTDEQLDLALEVVCVE